MEKVGIYGLIAVIVLVLIGGLGILTYYGVINQITGSGEYFEVPEFGYIQCAEYPGSPVTSDYSLSGGVYGFVQCPENSKTCDVSVSYPNLGTFNIPRRVEFYVCEDKSFRGCGSPQYTNDLSKGVNNLVIYNNLPTEQPNGEGKVLYMEFQKAKGIFGNYERDDGNRGNVKIQYQPYALRSFTVTGGGLNWITIPSGTTNTCKLGNQDEVLKGVVSSTLKTNDDTSKGTLNLNKDRLLPGETFNFIVGSLTKRVDGNVVNYNGRTGYCASNIQGLGATIYGIGEVKTQEDISKIVDTQDIIGNVECCLEGKQVSNNQVCKNFKLETIKTDSETGETNVECSLISPCPPGRFVLNENTQETYVNKCVEGQCVISDVRVEECTTNGDCLTNQICSANFKCVDAGEIPGGGGEDRDKECGFGESYREATDGGLFGILDGKPAGCYTSGWVIWTIVALALIILVTIIVIIMRLTDNE